MRNNLINYMAQASHTLWLDNNLAFHSFVPKAADMTTAKRIGSRRLREELNYGRFALLQLPTFLFRVKDQAWVSTRCGAVRVTANLETMIVVDGSDLELNLCSKLHANW